MGIWIGLDVGSVSAKLAAIGDEADRQLFEFLALSTDTFDLLASSHTSLPIVLSKYRRIQGHPTQASSTLLDEFFGALKVALELVYGKRGPEAIVAGIRVVGSAARLISESLGAQYENEFKAIAKGIGMLHPEVRTVFEMGGECSKYIRLEMDASGGELGIADYETNGDCAAGTGSFIDQQASRLRYSVEEIGELALRTTSAARIAGRCSVFAKSDMIHAQQKGFTPPQILKGLCDAVARNFKASITKGKKVEPAVAFIGGLAVNKAVVQSLKELFSLSDEEFLVPSCYAWVGAIGAAALGRASGIRRPVPNPETLKSHVRRPGADFPTHGPLSLENVWLLRDRIKPYDFTRKPEIIDVYLGIDIGSVSTNLAVIDDQGDLLKEIYLRTEGRPIEQVDAGLKEIFAELGDRIRVRAVGTTGSGRELIGELIGADTVNDEITAHKTGAMYISEKLIDERVDTIFEIGGQDSKYIRIQDGVVVDFAMNEACAAGTGSFLEEQAEKLGISIKGEFSALALSSRRPIRLGERCTVFMERDVNAYLQKGAQVEDLVAGLAYSIALNYLNRVVRGRKIGDVIYFQGGTAYNDSVAAALSGLLNKRIIVPPHNGVVGALGMALMAREKIKATGAQTQFRGYDLTKIDYSVREFVCKACSNYCEMQEFNVEGVKSYWGDKCSDKFRKRPKVETAPVIPDLMALRKKLLLAEYTGPKGREIKIGIPMAMSFLESFPFWNRFFDELGFDVIVSDETNRKIAHDGIDLVVAEPCYPIKIAHGHVKDLLEKGVDFVFLPNLMNAEGTVNSGQSHHCPWNQTLPFVIKSAPDFEPFQTRFLLPTLHFRYGPEFVKKELTSLCAALKVSRRQISRAVERAYESQRRFKSQIQEAGEQALCRLLSTGEPGIVIVGRAYNIYDQNMNLHIPDKLRHYYGVNVIPIDFLPIDGMDIRDINQNMYWHSGWRILAAAAFVGRFSNLHIIYFSNFKCGPDSFIKHFVDEASGKPFLCLQFDGHSNDPGFLTRCEAYLDSKGILRRWKTAESTAVLGDVRHTRDRFGVPKSTARFQLMSKE